MSCIYLNKKYCMKLDNSYKSYEVTKAMFMSNYYGTLPKNEGLQRDLWEWKQKTLTSIS